MDEYFEDDIDVMETLADTSAIRPNRGLESHELTLAILSMVAVLAGVVLAIVWRKHQRCLCGAVAKTLDVGSNGVGDMGAKGVIGGLGKSGSDEGALVKSLLLPEESDPSVEEERSRETCDAKGLQRRDLRDGKFDYRIISLIMAYSCHALASYGIFRISLPYLVDEVVGAKDSRIMGLLAASMKASQFISNLVVGQISDRNGRKPTFLACFAGSGFSALLMAGAAEFKLGIWMVIVGVVINGLSNAMVSTTSAALCDVTSPSDRTRVLGLLGITVGAGTFVGPLIFDAVAARYGLSSVYFFMFGLYVFGICVHTTIRETLPHELRALNPIKINPISSMACLRYRPVLRLLCCVGALMSLADKFFMTLFVYYTMERYGLERGSIAWMLSVHGLVGALNQGVAMQLITKVASDYTIMTLGTVLATIANALLYVAPAVPLVWVSTIVRSVADSSYGPTLYSIASKSTNPAEVGQVLAALKTISIVGDVVGAQVAGSLFHAMQNPDHMPLVYLVAAAFAGCSSLITLAIHRYRKSSPNASLTSGP